MNWTMPRPVLQVVAAILGIACLGSFALGVATAPDRGRLPGEKAGGQAGPAIEATEATPLGEERIEGAPEPVPLTEEEKTKLEEEKKAKAEAAALAKAEAEKAAAAGATEVTPPAAATPATPPATPPPAAPPPKTQPEEPPF